MTVALDRVVEVALDELLGGFVVDDLSEQILEAAGQAPVTLARRRTPRRRARRPSTARDPRDTTAARRRRLSLSLLVAAAAVLITLLIGLLLREDGAVIVATSDRLVTVWRGEEELETDRLRANDCIYSGDSTAQLTLASGARIRVQRDSVVLLAGVLRIELLRGELGVESHSKPPVVTAPNRVVVTPRAQASLRLVLAPWPAGPDLRKTVTAMIEKKTIVATTLALSVFTGQADVLSAQGGKVVQAGATVELDGPPKMIKVDITPAERKHMERCITTLRSAKPVAQLGEDEAMMLMKDVSEASGDLVTLLRRRPEAIALMRDDLSQIALPKPNADAFVREALLDLLVLDEDPHVTSRVLGVLKKNPEWLSMRQLMTLAGRNQKAAITRIETLVRPRPDDVTLVPYASVLAMHKKPAGEKILRAYLAEAPGIGVDGRVFMAAVGLQLLGDKDAWSELRDRVKMKVDMALSEDNLREAQFVVLRAAYYHTAITTGKPIPLSGVLDPVQQYYSAHIERLKTAADVVAELRKL